MTKGLFLEFDFPDVEPHQALWMLTNDLEADAYYIADGRTVAVRNIDLAGRFVDLRLQALNGMARDWIAARKEQARDAASIEAAETAENPACTKNSGRRGPS